MRKINYPLIISDFDGTLLDETRAFGRSLYIKQGIKRIPSAL